MVKNLKKITFLFAAVMVLFAGCNNLSSGEISGDGLSGEGGSVTLSIANGDNLARMLAPDQLAAADIATLKVNGESLTGLKLTEVVYDASSDPKVEDILSGDEKATMTNVPLDDWNFTMTGYDSAGKLLVKGEAVCRMKSASATSCSFTLSTYNVETAGSAKITIKYDGKDWVATKYSFVWGVYDKTTGKTVSSLSSTVTAGENADKVWTSTGGGSGTGYDAEISSLEPGSYIFGVTIYNGTTVLAYASDVLLIEPGRATTKDFVITDIIGTAPKAPTGLKAQRYTDVTSGDYYNVRLLWTDESDNETKFKLVVKEFIDTASTTWASYAADEAKAVANASATRISVYSFDTVLTLDGTNVSDGTYSPNIKYVAGSLYAGSTELILGFPTGRLFDVQIIAENSFGSSASCVRVADATDATLGALAADTIAATATTTGLGAKYQKAVKGYDVSAAAAYKHISLVKIEYNLNGGTLKTDASTTYDGTTYVVYTPYTLNTEGSTDADKYIPLAKVGTAETFYELKKGTVAFTKWVETTSRVETEATYNIKAYENITVKAIYGVTTGSVEISKVDIAKQANLADSRVKAAYGTESQTSNLGGTDAKGASIKVTRGGSAQYITVAVDAATGEQTVFAYYILYLNGLKTGFDRQVGDAVTFTNIPTSSLETGKYNVIMVKGVTADGREASSSFTVKLGD